MTDGCVQLSGGNLSGMLLDNEANKERSGAGFNPLIHRLYAHHTLYRDDAVVPHRGLRGSAEQL